MSIEPLEPVDIEAVKAMIFNQYRVKFMSITEIVSQPETIVLLEDKVEKVMKQFETSNSKILPVIQKGKYFGFLSKIDVLENYRQRLKEMIID